MKKLQAYLVINLVLTAVFSLLSLSFHVDISLLAFPIAAAFSVCLYFFTYRELFKKKSVAHITAIRRFYQYEPFVFISTWLIQRAGNSGMPFALDFAGALTWILITVLSFVIGHFLADKRVFKLCPEWTSFHKEHPLRKPKGILRFFYELAEWIDALIQAVFIIMLLNIFLFQLYEIPSESMVPAFLIKDRVVVPKTLAGPKFPLSDVGLPYIQDYKKGDIVVFRNPHYTDDRKSEVKTFLSQFAYMCSFTLLKTNRDENGDLKADPLVKRVAGIAGEQLLMMDGTLYYRTAGSDFKESPVDKKFAAWNLNNLDKNTKSKIQYIPLSKDDVEMTLNVEKNRRELDLENVALECEKLSAEFTKYARSKNSKDSSYRNLLSESDLTIPSPFYSINEVVRNGVVVGRYLDDSKIDSIAIKLITSEGGSQFFDDFLNSWHRDLKNLSSYKEDGSVASENLVGGDLYSDASFRLNVMAKLLFGRIVLRDAELMSKGISFSDWENDSLRAENFSKAGELTRYILFMDQRNMPLFPANDSNGNAVYIPENSYFMMGDNRYNSLDMRHSETFTLTRLTNFDEMSIFYESNMMPQYVNRKKILGKASYRFWPLNRAGVPDSSLKK